MTQNTTKNEFDSSIEVDFAFLKEKHGFVCTGVRSVDDDSHDAYILARFTKGDERVDIAWNDDSQSLSILIRLCNDQLGRRERYIYFEPFIEFLTSGQVLPIAPQLFPQMTMNSIESVMRQRANIFSGGISSPIASLAQKLMEYLELVQSASAEVIREYHIWYDTRTA